MWIYNQTAMETDLVPAVPSEVPLLPELPTEQAPQDDTFQEKAATAIRITEEPPHRKFSTTDCWTLAAAFLIGTAAAGLVRALCGGQQLEWLDHYIQIWLETFSVSGAHSAVALFAVEYLALMGAATFLLLSGFSAFGPVLIFLFLMIYGAGNGLLAVQLLAGTGWQEKLLIFVLTEIPASAAVVCLCVLGAAALRVSGRIRAYSFLGLSLKNLVQGDAVTFTDMDGNVFCYQVAEIETLPPYATQEMTSGEWDLTLFTCTIGGQNRLTLR